MLSLKKANGPISSWLQTDRYTNGQAEIYRTLICKSFNKLQINNTKTNKTNHKEMTQIDNKEDKQLKKQITNKNDN